jgi:DNA-directed RNA polymerase alpha subunit
MTIKTLTCPHCQSLLDLSFHLRWVGLAPAKDEPWRKVPIRDLALGVRAINCFKNELENYPEEGWATAGDLDDKTDNEILRLPNMGRVTLCEIRQVLRCLKEGQHGQE